MTNGRRNLSKALVHRKVEPVERVPGRDPAIGVDDLGDARAEPANGQAVPRRGVPHPLRQPDDVVEHRNRITSRERGDLLGVQDHASPDIHHTTQDLGCTDIDADGRGPV